MCFSKIFWNFQIDKSDSILYDEGACSEGISFFRSDRLDKATGCDACKTLSGFFVTLSNFKELSSEVSWPQPQERKRCRVRSVIEAITGRKFYFKEDAIWIFSQVKSSLCNLSIWQQPSAARWSHPFMASSIWRWSVSTKDRTVRRRLPLLLPSGISYTVWGC